jgi:hypothetical protein
LWRLFYPLRYFSLENSEKKRIDIVATVILTIIIAAPFVLLPGASFFAPNGFLDKLLSLTSALTGFYVAALVAAATFSHPDLDKTINAGPIALVTRDSNGYKVSNFLTRRQFVCIIFGYLAFAALIISISSAVAIGLADVNTETIAHWRYIGSLFLPETLWYLRIIAILLFCSMTAHLVTTTSLGIYYLMDRLYRRDRQITTKKPGSEAA